MKANTKYVDESGTQLAMYPNQVMNITQSVNGYFSHAGTNAIDDAQRDGGISPGYAPCDMICVATAFNQANANAVWWQSLKPVRTVAHGVITISMMVLHDNTANARVGQVVKQGEQLFDEGTAGYATGNHNHIEVATGPFTTMYTLSGQRQANGNPVYMYPHNVNPSDIFYVNDTTILNGGGLNWRTYDKASNGTAKKEETKKYSNTKSEPKNKNELFYQAHIQNGGWLDAVNDGMIAGTTGQSLRLEALRIDTRRLGDKLKLDVKVHIADIGWKRFDNINPSTIIGTVGEGKQIEAIEIIPTVNKTGKQLKYQVHLADDGWTGEMSAGNTTGTTGIGKRVEAIRIWLQ